MVIIYEDESHIRDYQTLRATWSVKGRQKQIPTYGHHATVSLLDIPIWLLPLLNRGGRLVSFEQQRPKGNKQESPTSIVH